MTAAFHRCLFKELDIIDTPQIDFAVEAIEPIRLNASGELQMRDYMSPFVWRLETGGLGLLVRAVPRAGTPMSDTGAIWYGTSSDGLTFAMDEQPVIAPGPGPLDIGGCEDPTVVISKGGFLVYYTGVDETMSSGQMLYASGPNVHSMEKRGVALASSKTQGNTKEATVELTEAGKWTLFYEYAYDCASLIGLAVGDGPAGPWCEEPQPFAPRTDGWDSWHLSTGPMLHGGAGGPVMFYNGATRDARWRIGWIAFDKDCTHVVDRCIEPLIVPPPQQDRSAADIAFAASVIETGDIAHVYYSLADRTLERAVIRRYG